MNDDVIMNDEEFDDLVTLYANDGQSVDFLILGTVNHEGKKYAVLSPWDFCEEVADNECVIFLIQETEDDEMFIPVEDWDIIDAVFAKFKSDQFDLD